MSDLYDRFWHDQAQSDTVLREQRVAARDAGTTLLTSSLNHAVAAIVAIHQANPSALVITNFAEKPAPNAIRGASTGPLVLRAKGKREGAHVRDRGDLLVS